MISTIIKNHIDERITSFFNYPETWGSREAIEFGIVHLIEIELLTLNSEYLREHPRIVVLLWDETIGTNQPLFFTHRHSSNSEWASALSLITQKVRGKILEIVNEHREEV